MTVLILELVMFAWYVTAGVLVTYANLKWGDPSTVRDNLMFGVGAGTIWGFAFKELMRSIRDYRNHLEMQRRIEQLQSELEPGYLKPGPLLPKGTGKTTLKGLKK